jgi:hypothetical protein
VAIQYRSQSADSSSAPLDSQQLVAVDPAHPCQEIRDCFSRLSAPGSDDTPALVDFDLFIFFM